MGSSTAAAVSVASVSAAAAVSVGNGGAVAGVLQNATTLTYLIIVSRVGAGLMKRRVSMMRTVSGHNSFAANASITRARIYIILSAADMASNRERIKTAFFIDFFGLILQQFRAVQAIALIADRGGSILSFPSRALSAAAIALSRLSAAWSLRM